MTPSKEALEVAEKILYIFDNQYGSRCKDKIAAALDEFAGKKVDEEFRRNARACEIERKEAVKEARRDALESVNGILESAIAEAKSKELESCSLSEPSVILSWGHLVRSLEILSKQIRALQEVKT